MCKQWKTVNQKDLKVSFDKKNDGTKLLTGMKNKNCGVCFITDSFFIFCLNM